MSIFGFLRKGRKDTLSVRFLASSLGHSAIKSTHGWLRSEDERLQLMTPDEARLYAIVRGYTLTIVSENGYIFYLLTKGEAPTEIPTWAYEPVEGYA